MLTVLLVSVALFVPTGSPAPDDATDDVFFYAVMRVESCALGQKDNEGFWLSTVARTDERTFDDDVYRVKVRRAFIRFDEGIARNCKVDLRTLRHFDSRRDARDARRRQRDDLEERDAVHTWRLDVS